ncbi:Na/Pi symporter [Shouchella lonarensis]|uniref:Phosphate:Na+ symporter n=1 Tax=Shouchella lonarensis TaxID=1464122 RepID=A0A1G6KIX6_9BACI|nr:Na/Pi symporter [Shouchella lonarensis]SDC30914.1 phosphate:Na+ symporter [Shouchella lonarensis]
MGQEWFSLIVVFITLFLFGMFILRSGLMQIGARRLQPILLRATDSAWKGLIIGTVITAIFQSSTIVMIMVVGFVATQLLTFRHTIGIILGTNIGSCFTLELIAFRLTDLAVPLIGLGIFFLLFPKKILYCLGSIFFGVGAIFLAMHGLETLATPLAAEPMTHTFFHWTNAHALSGIVVGAVMTMIVQSSTATIAMAMSFIQDSALNMASGIAIMLGANIGTCLTAYIASIGASKAARLVAYAHIWLNLLGAIAFFPLIGFLAHISSLLAESTSMQLAHASVIYNVICSLVVLPFAHIFARFIERIHGRMGSIS